MDTYFFAQQVQRNWYSRYPRKKRSERFSVQQQQQLSIEILTNLSNKTSMNTRYNRTSVVKEKARSRSRCILLRVSSEVLTQTIAQGISYRYVVLSNRVYVYKQQVSIETLANRLNCQQISIDTLANLLNWAIGFDRNPWKPIALGNRYRSISSHTPIALTNRY